VIKTEGNRDSNSMGVYISFSQPQEASIAIIVWIILKTAMAILN